jgi:peroxiredoxin
MLTEGAKMPHVEAVDDTGAHVNASSFEGRPLVLWFYPKDDTPG